MIVEHADGHKFAFRCDTTHTAAVAGLTGGEGGHMGAVGDLFHRACRRRHVARTPHRTEGCYYFAGKFGMSKIEEAIDHGYGHIGATPCDIPGLVGLNGRKIPPLGLVREVRVRRFKGRLEDFFIKEFELKLRHLSRHFVHHLKGCTGWDGYLNEIGQVIIEDDLVGRIGINLFEFYGKISHGVLILFFKNEIEPVVHHCAAVFGLLHDVVVVGLLKVVVC